MTQIRVSGIFNTEDLDEDHVDLDSHTGLSEEGYQAVVHGEAGPVYQLKLSDLEDLEFTKEDDQ